MSGDKCGQNGDNESVYLHGLNMWFRNYYVAYAFVKLVCVETKNEELFLMQSRLNIYIVLVVDGLRGNAQHG